MRHPGDAERLDHDLAAGVLEYLVRKPLDRVLYSARWVYPVDVGPLLHFRGRVDRVYGRVGASVPDRHSRERPGVMRGMPHKIAPLSGSKPATSGRRGRAKQGEEEAE